jgi:hypothetical protein
MSFFEEPNILEYLSINDNNPRDPGDLYPGAPKTKP